MTHTALFPALDRGPGVARLHVPMPPTPAPPTTIPGHDPTMPPEPDVVPDPAPEPEIPPTDPDVVPPPGEGRLTRRRRAPLNSSGRRPMARAAA